MENRVFGRKKISLLMLLAWLTLSRLCLSELA
jgi:hypothetical protein